MKQKVSEIIGETEVPDDWNIKRKKVPGTTSTYALVFEGGGVVEVKNAALRRPGGPGLPDYAELFVFTEDGRKVPLAYDRTGSTYFKSGLIAVVRVEDD